MHEDEPHLPAPTLWPLGFALGIAVGLVGLIVDPVVIGSIGGAIAIVFGFLWVREATSDLRGHVPEVEPERRQPAAAAVAPSVGEQQTIPRSKFLEATT